MVKWGQSAAEYRLGVIAFLGFPAPASESARHRRNILSEVRVHWSFLFCSSTRHLVWRVPEVRGWEEVESHSPRLRLAASCVEAARSEWSQQDTVTQTCGRYLQFGPRLSAEKCQRKSMSGPASGQSCHSASVYFYLCKTIWTTLLSFAAWQTLFSPRALFRLQGWKVVM